METRGNHFFEFFYTERLAKFRDRPFEHKGWLFVANFLVCARKISVRYLGVGWEWCQYDPQRFGKQICWFRIKDWGGGNDLQQITQYVLSKIKSFGANFWIFSIQNLLCSIFTMSKQINTQMGNKLNIMSKQINTQMGNKLIFIVVGDTHFIGTKGKS